jgi:putative nucleotidyltransferase with HDIG domain
VTVEVLTSALALHHPPTAAHCERVAELSQRVAERLGAEPLECVLIRQAALLHDLGKLILSAEALERPGPLTPAEWAIMRRHPDRAAALILAVPGLETLAETVRTSHERLDGSGYPAGHPAAELERPARVVAVCDAFCSMTEGRPYRRARTEADAMRELRADAGTRFDAAAVAALAAEVVARAPRAAA